MIRLIIVAPPLTKTGAGAVDSQRNARLSRLIREQFGFVWRLLRGLGASELEADAAAEEVFIAASQRIGDIRAGSERSFLFSATLHVAGRMRRSRTEEEAISDGALALEDLDEQRQAREILGALLEQMPLELRVVFVLREIEQLTNVEIADVVGIPIAMAASRLAEAQEDLATHLESESDLSQALILAAREEQPPSDALVRALTAAGVTNALVRTHVEETGAVSSPGESSVRSVRSESPTRARSSFALAAKWLALGVIAGLLVSSIVYAVSDAATRASAAVR